MPHLLIAERGAQDTSATMNGAGAGAGGSRRGSRSGRGRPLVGWCGGVRGRVAKPRGGMEGKGKRVVKERRGVKRAGVVGGR